MEALYAKIYDKYQILKTKRAFETQQLCHDQQGKFVHYVNSAEELIERLRSENDSLQTELNQGNHEMRSLRSTCDEYKKLFIVECQKTKELSKEVERLQNLQQEGFQSQHADASTGNLRIRKQKSDDVIWDSSGGTQVGSEDILNGSLRKRPRVQPTVFEPYDGNQLHCFVQANVENGSHGGSLSDAGHGLQLANYTLREPVSSEDYTSADLMLQTLMESLVGLKFAFIDEAEGCLSIVHQSSGYTFSLTWVSRGTEEAELLYQVSSLGTIVRVAKDWMKEEIMFSLNMFPAFMKRVSKVLGVQI